MPRLLIHIHGHCHHHQQVQQSLQSLQLQISSNLLVFMGCETPNKLKLAGVHGVRWRRNGAVNTPKQKQPSIVEVERAIGIRDEDPTTRNSSEKSTIFDMDGRPESFVEKKLRKTGEWLIDSNKSTSLSSGQEILFVVSLWILPIWMFLLLVASGFIKLPCGIPFLDDLIM